MAIFRLFINTVFYFCRTSDRYHIFGNILCHDRACTDHGIISNSDTRKDSRVRAYPYVFAYVYRLWYQIVTFFGEQTVIQRCKHRVMTDQRTVTNENATLILKLTARIDEYPLAEMNVFPQSVKNGGNSPTSTGSPISSDIRALISSGV